jgi:hypothetical protein
MSKTVNIGSKTITVTQLVVAIVVGVFALGGGFWGMLEAEDRWNQQPSCAELTLKNIQLKENMLAGFKQMHYQQNVRFEEGRLHRLNDELVKARVRLSQDPRNQVYQQEVNYLMQEIQKTKSNLEKLHKERAQ